MRVRLRQYEGPLDLLVDLIESQEFDIWDIPIAQITDQYLAYLARMEEARLEIGSEFLVMAATLLAIKARMLLPPPPSASPEVEEADDPRRVLALRLAEYQRFRRAAAGLDALLVKRGVVAGRGAPPPRGRTLYANPVGKATVADLVEAYVRLLEAARSQSPAWRLPEATVTVEERATQLLTQLERQLRVSFSSLVSKGASRRLVIVTFLAMLEVVRQGLAVMMQAAPFEPIWLERASDGPADAAGSENAVQAEGEG